MTDFWIDQRVLVTGASGFLGQHLHALLFELVGESNLFGTTKRYIDLRQPKADDLEFSGLTLVIHCAANVGGIGKNRAQPAQIMYDNLLMNTHVLHEAYAAGVQKFVGIGSVCAYPKHAQVPFQEADLFNGYPEATNAPYGISKRALLVMSQAYRQQYGFNAIHLILANLYGPGDNFDLETGHVIPSIMRKMHEAKVNGDSSVTLWGNGMATREFLYVEDAAAAIVRAAEGYDDGEPLNIGTYPSEVTIAEVAGLIARVVGYDGDIVWDTSQPNGQPRRSLDTTRARKALDWQAQMPLEDGLQKTYDWYVRECKGEVV